MKSKTRRPYETTATQKILTAFQFQWCSKGVVHRFRAYAGSKKNQAPMRRMRAWLAYLTIGSP
jgi:hypothetical protein